MGTLDALYLTDEQIARRIGQKPAEWKATARVLEKDGLPRRNPLFGDRRYWPAIVAFLDRMEARRTPSASGKWEEKFNDKRTRTETPPPR